MMKNEVFWNASKGCNHGNEAVLGVLIDTVARKEIIRNFYDVSVL